MIDPKVHETWGWVATAIFDATISPEKMSQDGVRKDINVNRPCRSATSRFGNKESMIDP